MTVEGGRSALVAGATGLVGRMVLEMLLSHQGFAGVTALARRPIDRAHPVLRTVSLDLADLDTLEPLPSTDAFCALGTTMRAAGGRPGFRQVDLEFVVKFAALARRSGVTRLVMVSAVGARPSAGSFYSRTKGEAEAAVAAYDFPVLHILRPSLLLGERAESRPMERALTAIAPVLTPFLRGRLRRYQPISAETVAAAMLGAALSDQTGRHVHHFDEIHALATNF